MPNDVKPPALWLIQAGVVLMALGVGGFIGFAIGQYRPNLTQTRAELHANNAEYDARRLIDGMSKLEKKPARLPKTQKI